MDIEGAEKILVPDIVSVLDKVDNFFSNIMTSKMRNELGEMLHMLKSKGFQYYLSPVSKLPDRPFAYLANDKNLFFQVNVFAKRGKIQ
jgi:hypothetical protein